jgi:basic membrane protein A
MVLVVACGGAGAGNNDSRAAGSGSSGGQKTVVQLVAGSLGDQGIFDSGDQGLRRAEKDLGIEYKLIEAQQRANLLGTFLNQAATEGNLVFVNPGYQWDSFLQKTTSDNPDTTFVYADGVSPVKADNIVSISYSENEGSYLAGLMAAMMTTRTDVPGMNPDKKLGIVGAFSNPVINNFVVGFKQGAKSVDPEMDVEVLYAGSYTDPAKGKELALNLYDQGADIVYQVAAATGDGVILAAKERHEWVIGVDTDKCSQGPEVVLSSMVKNVGESFYQTTKSWLGGELRPNETLQFGLKRGGVGMTYDSHCTKKHVPQDVIAAMKKAQQQIVAGKIKVDSTK